MSQLSPEVLSALSTQISSLVQAQIEGEIASGRLIRPGDIAAKEADLQDREARLLRLKEEIIVARDQLTTRIMKVAQGMVGIGEQARTYLHQTLLLSEHADSYEPSEEALDILDAATGQTVDREDLRNSFRTAMRNEIERFTQPKSPARGQPAKN